MKQFMMLLLVLSTLMVGFVYAQDYAVVRATMLNQQPLNGQLGDPVEPGDDVWVRFRVENFGEGVIHNVTLSLIDSYPFTVEDGAYIIPKLYSLQQDEDSVVVKFTVHVADDATEGTHLLTMRIVTQDSGYSEMDFPIEISEKDFAQIELGAIQSVPTKLVSDLEDAKLEVEVLNVGDKQADSVITQLILPEGMEPSYSYSNLDNLGSIAAHGSQVAEFYIDIDEDVSEGGYNGTLEVRYKEEYEDEYVQKEYPMLIPVKGSAKLEIVGVSTDPVNPIPGSDVILHVKVRNTGSKEADSISVKGFKHLDQPMDFDQKSNYVGKLGPGETGEAILTFAVDDDAIPKSYQMDLELRALEDEKVVVFEETIPFKVYDVVKKSIITQQHIIGAVIVVVIVVGGLLVFSFFRKVGKGKKKK